MIETIDSLRTWTNQNSGFTTVIIFLLTLFLGWVSGIFQALRNHPKFILRVISGPTLCSLFFTDREYQGHKTHRFAVALYLEITNKGSAPSDIGKISVAYHNYSFIHTFFWYWLNEETTSLRDFSTKIGEDIKVYPFLKQVSTIIPNERGTYLRIGEVANGIVYFEQEECWGSYRPRIKNGYVKFKIKVKDTFGSSHRKSVWIPIVSLEKAQEFNAEFGMTREKIRSQTVAQAENDK